MEISCRLTLGSWKLATVVCVKTPAKRAAMLAVYEARKMTLNPPHTLMRNLLGHDFGALNATRWLKRRPYMTHRAEARLKFLVRWRPHGLRPKGLSHSYMATASAVTFSVRKIPTHKSILNGFRKASRGTSIATLVASRIDRPEKKYGIVKSMTSLRTDVTLRGAKLKCAAPDFKSATIPSHLLPRLAPHCPSATTYTYI